MKKGLKIKEGKTKWVWNAESMPGMVIVENKNDITKNDNPDETRVMTGKAELATSTTCAVFQLLKEAGIPVAFERQLSSTEFLAPEVEMIPSEVIWRRYAVGSFLKRHPDLEVPEGTLPHRFHRAVFELFLKTTGGIIRNKNGDQCGVLPDDPETGRPIDDPFIINPNDEEWLLYHPKKPSWDKEANLHRAVLREDILPGGITVEKIEDLLRQVGLVLESAWASLGCRFIDIKIELGITIDGQLVVADVIDADSWRLRDPDWNELSKQLFRDGAPMEKIMDKYALVAKLAERFRIPRQAVVVWCGSKDDPIPEVPVVAGVKTVTVVLSGHKSPQRCLLELEKILTDFPEGGVILACVGMSNGLGPVLSARSSWPVIGVPVTAEKFQDDVWSSLRMPSQVPMGTIMSPKNAVLMALNILAQKNPAAYAARQMAIEELDD